MIENRGAKRSDSRRSFSGAWGAEPPISIALRAALVALAFTAITARANADGETVRVVGIGSAFGGGYGVFTVPTTLAAVTGNSSANVIPAISWTLEGQVFVNKREWSIDLTIPLLNVLVISVANRGLFFQADVFFNFNLPLGDARSLVTRFIVGPGLGFAVAETATFSNASFRIPVEAGVEFLLFHRHVGIKLLARPWIEIAAGEAQTVGGGALALLGVSGYITRTAH